MSYGTKYKLTFYDSIGRYITAELQERDYTGAIEEIKGSGENPVQITFDGEQDKYDPIKTLSCTLEIWSEINFKFLNLFTSDAKKYKLVVSRREQVEVTNEYVNVYTAPAGAFSLAQLYSSTPIIQHFTVSQNTILRKLSIILLPNSSYIGSVMCYIIQNGTQIDIGACNPTGSFIQPVDMFFYGNTVLQTGVDYELHFYMVSVSYSAKIEMSGTNVNCTLYGVENAGASFVDKHIFEGFIEPDIYQEPYSPPPYLVKIRAVDGLVRLKKTDFSPALSSPAKQLDIILYCLNQIGLDLNLNIICDIYELRMTQTGSPFAFAYNNLNAFPVDSKGKPKNCYDVLKAFMLVYGCRLFQYNGEWMIVRLAELFTDFSKSYKYNTLGQLIAGNDYDQLFELTPANIFATDPANFGRFMYVDNMMMILPGWKKFTINQDFQTKPSIIPNYDFSKYYIGSIPINPTIKLPLDWDLITDSTINNWVYIAGPPGANIETWPGLNFITKTAANPTSSYVKSKNISFESSGLVFSIKINFTIPIHPAEPGGLFRCAILFNDGQQKYLQTDGSFGTSFNWFELNFDTEINSVTDSFQITTQETLHSGILNILIYKNIHGTKKLIVTNVMVTILEQQDVVVNNNLELTTTLDENNNVESEIPLTIGDIPDINNTEIIYNGGILLADGTATKEWKELNSNFQSTLAIMLAKNIAAQQTRPTQQLQGTVKGVIDFLTVIIDPYNSYRKFVASNQMEWNLKKAEIHGTWWELIEGYRVLGGQAEDLSYFALVNENDNFIGI